METKEQAHDIKDLIRRLISFLRDQEIIATDREKDEQWQLVKKEAEKQRRVIRHNLVTRLLSAAAIAGLLWCGFSYLRSLYGDNRILQIADNLSGVASQTDEVLLVVSEKKQLKVGDNPQVSYSNDGSVTVNSKPVSESDESTKDSKTQDYNQIVVPKGKRSQLDLSDGTKLWINAGSRVVYPVQFSGSERQLFIEGEVYLEVAHDTRHPFVVKTKGFDIQVLGTKFNVSSYKDSESSEIVLAEGSVEVKHTNGGNVSLEPNQLIKINSNGFSDKETVDANDYISWTEDILILHDQPIIPVLNKLSLYFGTNIVSDESLQDIQLSGKLHLKEHLDDILRLIAETAPILYFKESDRFVVKRKSTLTPR